MDAQYSPSNQTLRLRNPSLNGNGNGNGEGMTASAAMKGKKGGLKGWMETASFMKWGFNDVVGVLKYHPMPCFFAVTLLFFMGVEYTLGMIPSDSPPLDVGFVATRWLNRVLSSSPSLNTLLAALNTVFVGMQTTYILWVFLVEGRVRPGLAALFMFTCRGILGYSTQLPLPQEFVGSGADFPVGNLSFFLFYSGHVASSVIASLDMRRMQRRGLAWTFDFLNVLQVVRLLGTRGHYTIDLAVGVGAGVLFDSLAGKYEDSRKLSVASPPPMGIYSPLR